MTNANYQPYPTCEESGVEWVGETPAGWEVLPFFVRASQCKRSNKGMVNDNLLSLSFGRVVRKDIATSEGLLPESFETYQVVEPDDVVFRLTDLQNDKRSLRSARCRERGIITSAYLAVQPVGIEPRYLAYLMRSYDLTKVFYALGSGLRQSLKYSDMKRLPLLVPPLGEQITIAKFLDYETAKIDALIEKQQHLIALLKEKRQAVISHAVTKGLNPNAGVRDSGVEWLGVVPAHWTVGKCGFCLSILSGFAFPSSGFSEDENDVRLLRGINVAVSRIRWEETVRWRRGTGDGLEPYEMVEGDLVLGMDRPLISEGVRAAKIGPDDVPCLLLQRVASLKTGDRLSSDYFMHLLSSDMFEAHFSPETKGVSVPHISPTQIADFVIPIPPIEEQKKIVAQLDTQTRRLDALALRATEAEELLQERRTALISAAVTGKIDVRAWKAPESQAHAEVA
ncbi:MAG: restriction modification system DNA specificity domain-containing protein [Gemmatimonadota bacterium]|nr:MAG: restriction modification system DNA specificity domain-containing protein [Gemmatimonadota bacterium]